MVVKTGCGQYPGCKLADAFFGCNLDRSVAQVLVVRSNPSNIRLQPQEVPSYLFSAAK
jgi:hypothetical protein